MTHGTTTELTYEALLDVENLLPKEKQAVGVVVQPAVHCALVAQLQDATGGKPDLPNISNACWGLPIFIDLEQDVSAIVFYDDEMLRAYLNRKENPKRWARVLLRNAGIEPEF